MTDHADAARTDADRSPDDPVEVIRVHSAREAAEITDFLLRAGIPAAPEIGRAAHRVVVPPDWIEIAEAAVDAAYHRPEGEASRAEIEQELAAHRGEGERHSFLDGRIGITTARPSRARRLWLLLLVLYLLVIGFLFAGGV